MDQHYLPQFYLREWCAHDGKLWRYRKERPGSVSVKRVAPRSTAFEPDLYTLGDTGAIPDDDPQIIETKYFAEIDGRGAVVFQKLLSFSADGGRLEGELSDGDRDDWARLLASISLRHADDVLERDRQAPSLAETVFTNWMAAAADDESRSRLAEGLSRLDTVQLAKNTHRGVMLRKIPEVAASLTLRPWMLLRAAADTPFVTGDRPVVVHQEFHDERHFLVTMPLSPGVLFIASPPTWPAGGEELQTVAHTFPHLHNALLVQDATRCVYAKGKITDSYFRRCMEVSLPTYVERTGTTC